MPPRPPRRFSASPSRFVERAPSSILGLLRVLLAAGNFIGELINSLIYLLLCLLLLPTKLILTLLLAIATLLIRVLLLAIATLLTGILLLISLIIPLILLTLLSLLSLLSLSLLIVVIHDPFPLFSVFQAHKHCNRWARSALLLYKYRTTKRTT